jgi:hypothetical protein
MFSSNALVKRVEMVPENRFYVEAEFVAKEDLDHVKMDLNKFDDGFHSNALVGVRAGKHIFRIEGKGESPFKTGDRIRVRCFSRGETPY